MKKEEGFTLIETIIYIAILGMVLVSFVMFSLYVIQIRDKSYSIQEVNSNARLALELMTQEVQSANGINTGSSTFDLDPGVLSLSMADAAKNPTIISLDEDNGTLQIQRGASSPINITSSDISITNLVFTDLTPSNRNGNVKINFTASYKNLESQDYIYSQDIETSVTLRN